MSSGFQWGPIWGLFILKRCKSVSIFAYYALRKELLKGHVARKWQVKFVSNFNFEKLLVKLKHVLSNWTERTLTSNITDNKEFAGNQGKHQNWVLSILSHNLSFFVCVKKNPKWPTKKQWVFLYGGETEVISSIMKKTWNGKTYPFANIS